jgi:hypothetical protein
VFADREAYVLGRLLATAAALGDTTAARSARAALDRLLARAYVPGASVRHALIGSVTGLLQDQVQVAAACLAAYEASGEPRYLTVARDLAALLERDYADPRGGYFDAAQPEPAAPAPAARTRQVLDGRLPGANAWAARFLFGLADATGDPRYRARADATLAAFAGAVEGAGARAASYLAVARDALDPR